MKKTLSILYLPERRIAINPDFTFKDVNDDDWVFSHGKVLQYSRFQSYIPKKIIAAFPILGSLPLLPEPPEEDTEMKKIVDDNMRRMIECGYSQKDFEEWKDAFIAGWQANPKKFTREEMELIYSKGVSDALKMQSVSTSQEFEKALSSLHPRPSQLIFDDTDMVDENGYLKVIEWKK